MDYGVGIFATDTAIDPAALARLVEARGHESLFFAEHTHIPVSRDTPYPHGGVLPRKYSHCHDLFVALTAAAVATTRLRIGSAICLVAQRDPIITAKQVASVDRLSGGRLEFGIGAGWNRDEMRNHGTDPRTRMEVMREHVEAMRAIWMHDEAAYHGRHVDFDPLWLWPKPLQRPHPPILVGGTGPTVLDRVLAYGDAWFPNLTGDADVIIARAQELRARAKRPIEVQVSSVPADPALLVRLRDAGVRRVVHWLPSATGATVERALERWEAVIAECET
jgi:probable F420-dependent oxidoreductase